MTTIFALVMVFMLGLGCGAYASAVFVLTHGSLHKPTGRRRRDPGDALNLAGVPVGADDPEHKPDATVQMPVPPVAQLRAAPSRRERGEG